MWTDPAAWVRQSVAAIASPHGTPRHWRLEFEAWLAHAAGVGEGVADGTCWGFKVECPRLLTAPAGSDASVPPPTAPHRLRTPLLWPALGPRRGPHEGGHPPAPPVRLGAPKPKKSIAFLLEGICGLRCFRAERPFASHRQSSCRNCLRAWLHRSQHKGGLN